ncbi:MAG: hypothetical protein EA380_08960, partial [Phycisphaeraceae bacterium]
MFALVLVCAPAHADNGVAPDERVDFDSVGALIGSQRDAIQRLREVQERCFRETHAGRLQVSRLRATAALFEWIDADEFDRLPRDEQRRVTNIYPYLSPRNAELQSDEEALAAAQRALIRYRALAEQLGPVAWPDFGIRADLGIPTHARGELTHAELHRNLIELRSAVIRVLFWESARFRAALEEGNSDEARDASRTIVAAYRWMASAPFFMGNSFAGFLVSSFCDDVRWGLEQGLIDQELAEELALLLAQVERWRTPYECIMVFEQARSLLAHCEQLEVLRAQHADRDKDDLDARLVELRDFFMLESGMFEAFSRADDGSHDLIGIRANFAAAQASLIERWPDVDGSLRVMLSDGVRNFYVRDAVAVRPHLLVTRTMLAIELYRAAEGGYPKTLQALVPRYLAEVPIDPFGGPNSVLGYRVLGDDHTLPVGTGYALWTIGPNPTPGTGEHDLASIDPQVSGLEAIDPSWLVRDEAPAGAWLLNHRVEQV